MQKISALLFLFLCVPVIVQAGEDGYGYPVPGSYAATIMGTPPSMQLEKPKHISMKQLVLDIYPKKKKPDIITAKDAQTDRCVAWVQTRLILAA